jgi:phosphate-selective porin O/P
MGRLEVGANAFWSRDTNVSVPKQFGFDSTPETPAADNLFTGRHDGAGLDEHFERGIWAVDAEWLRVRFEQDASGAVDTAEGWYATPSAFVWRRLLQIAGRYEWFRSDLLLSGNEISVWTGGLNYYARGDNAKLMVDYLWVKTPDASDHAKLLARVQVMF